MSSLMLEDSPPATVTVPPMTDEEFAFTLTSERNDEVESKSDSVRLSVTRKKIANR